MHLQAFRLSTFLVTGLLRRVAHAQQPPIDPERSAGASGYRRGPMSICYMCARIKASTIKPSRLCSISPQTVAFA